MAGYAKSLIEKWTALYVRLSRDDDNEGDSNSISHQVEILTKYAKEHGIENFKIYKDDGFSGTNFNRPGFQEMMGDIENGLVSMVVVKDMSRFGRNYLEVGMYTEIRFPEMGVRFIAVNDGVDSEREDNDFTPFRNIINEWYAKDTSKKIRAVFRNKGMSGQRISTQTPYGYLRNEDGNLYVDEETAPNVRLIFQLCAEGNGPGKIARMLKEQVIPTPGTLEFQRTGRTRWYRPDDPCRWTPDTVAGILEQDSYLGRTSNFKFSRVSYKSKKKVENPPEKWVTFENTHEAIIDVELWNAVQKIRSQRRRPTRWARWGCSQASPTAPTVAQSYTIAGPARGPMSRNVIIALPKSLIRGASGITSAPWYWNSLCFKTSSASLPTFRRTRMSLRSLSCETKPQRKRQSRCRPDAF